jgi:predicted ATPase
LALGPALIATKGLAAPEVEQTYAEARALCAQVGETPQLFPTLRALCWFYQTRGVLGSSPLKRGHEHHRSSRRCNAREGRPRRLGGVQRGGGT